MKTNLVKIVYCLLFVALGMILGVFFSQYHYFKLNTELSLSDLFIFVLTALVGLYISHNIQKSLTRIQTIKGLYHEDLKGIISNLNVIDIWISQGNVPFLNVVAHMKMMNTRLRSLEKLYGQGVGINARPLSKIITDLNTFKSSLTALPPVQTSIQLNPTQTSDFSQQIEDIRLQLFNAIILS